jgi:hypothetical protein
MRVSYLMLTAAPLTLAAACSVYDSSLLLPAMSAGGSSGTATGGGGGTAGDAGSGGQAACVLKTYPPQPTSVPAVDKDIAFVSVMHSIDLGDEQKTSAVPFPTRFRTLGFDMDQLCTTEANVTEAQCRLPAYADGVLDGPGGVDNAVGASVQFVRNSITEFSSQHYSDSLAAGKSNVILRVSGYNGEANDAKVRVDALVSAAFELEHPGETPKWDGTDTFPVASDSVLDGDRSRPRSFDPGAYVTNNQLVASLTAVPLHLEVGLTPLKQVKLSLSLLSAFVVCDIVTLPDNAGFKATNCTLGARWKANDLLQQLWNFPEPLVGGDQKVPLCKGAAGSYDTFKKTVCGLVDVYSLGRTGPTTECDSLSMGLTFQTDPGILGNVYEQNEATDPCPVGSQPSTDTCETLENADSGPAATGGRSGTGGTQATGGAKATGGTTNSGGSDASTDSGISDASAD